MCAAKLRATYFCLITQAYAGERACYHSMVGFNSQLVLLGTKSVHVMTMRNWQDVRNYQKLLLLMNEIE